MVRSILYFAVFAKYVQCALLVAQLCGTATISVVQNIGRLDVFVLMWITLQALGGILTAVVIKYMNNIVKARAPI
jgi:hypothetical protein